WIQDQWQGVRISEMTRNKRWGIAIECGEPFRFYSSIHWGTHMLKALWCIGLGSALVLAGCRTQSEKVADLAAIYDRAAQEIGPDRTPVVVIPGILGSKLVDSDGTKVWGSFTF